MNIFDHYRQRYEAAKDEEFTLQEFLTTCRQDRSAYANAAERLLMAIGEPVMVDTAQEPRLSRLFSNRVIARYPAFEEFYGMEDAIEQIVSYLKHAAQGLEEKKQILYLLGPVGGGKSSLAERLKSLMQLVPIYVLSANGERSPVNDHPFCLFNPQVRRKMRRFWKKSMAFLAAISAPSCRRGRQNACMNLVAISLSSG
ncbi:putative Ser protein kinase [Shigella sonnei]|nr:putative Ser protein kinase [Shigella sonnei]